MTFDWNPVSVFIILFLLFGLVNGLINYFSIRRFDQYPISIHFPRVSILVPARNEALNIEACLTSLLNQDYPDFEVIVLDDQSTDETRQIIERLARSNEHLLVLDGTVLPEGWLGKHWACHQLYLASSGDLMLFTDADTTHAPDMLRASVSALFHEKADLITGFPQEEVVSMGEKLIVPIIGFGIFTFIPIPLVQKLRLSALSITIGQFMLFRREAYQAIGGFESVKSEVVDDMCLGRNIINNGLEWRFLDGTRHVSCRMYHNFWDSVSGFSKSLFAVFDYRILPYLGGWFLVGVVFVEPVISLVSRWMGYPLTSMSGEAAALGVGLSIIIWMIAYKRFKFPPYMVFFYPLSIIIFIMIAVRSFFQTIRGTTTWKDRAIEKEAVRWL